MIKKIHKAFTLVELMIVSTIMIMVAGVLYTYHVNMMRTYHKGSEALLQLQDAQNVMEKMAFELRNAFLILELKPDRISFQRYFDKDDANDDSPVENLNDLDFKVVHYRVRKDKKDFYVIERRETGTMQYKPIINGFRSKGLKPDVFSGWRWNRKKFVPYESHKWSPDKMCLIKLKMEIESKKTPLHIFKKVFIAPLYKDIPLIGQSVSEELRGGAKQKK